MRAAFKDELSKIAGEMQGFTRIGRKPISIDRLLEREVESELKPSEVAPAGIGEPVSEKTSAPNAKALGVAALGGAGLYHVARRANEDRKLGRMMRKQQG
jgi:hypothetical protein